MNHMSIDGALIHLDTSPSTSASKQEPIETGMGESVGKMRDVNGVRTVIDRSLCIPPSFQEERWSQATENQYSLSIAMYY